jgi:hypothetical protein
MTYLIHYWRYADFRRSRQESLLEVSFFDRGTCTSIPSILYLLHLNITIQGDSLFIALEEITITITRAAKTIIIKYMLFLIKQCTLQCTGSSVIKEAFLPDPQLFTKVFCIPTLYYNYS